MFLILEYISYMSISHQESFPTSTLEEKLNSDEKLQKQIKEGDKQIEKIVISTNQIISYLNLKSKTNTNMKKLRIIDKKIVENITT